MIKTRSSFRHHAVLIFATAFIICWPGLVSQALGAVDTLKDKQAGVENLQTRLAEKLTALCEQHAIPGISLAYITEDGKQGRIAVGLADKENGIGMKPSDRMLSGSIGKTYVAAVALQMADEKKLDLDTKISKWLEEKEWFPRLPNHAKITVRMLMNHTSGLPDHVHYPEFGEAVGNDPDRIWSPEERLAYILDEKPLFEAGKGWAYADTNYIVLGMIIEKIAGRAFYEEITHRILRPCELKDTLPADKRKIPGLIPGYADRPSPFKKQGRTMVDGTFVINPQAEWTGGGFVSTPLDLARWARILFTGNIISDALIKEALEGKPAYTGPGDQYGLGIMIWKSGHGDVLGHAGWFPGYLSLMGFYKEKKIAVALQINSDGMPDALSNFRKLFDEVADLISPGK